MNYVHHTTWTTGQSYLCACAFACMCVCGWELNNQIPFLFVIVLDIDECLNGNDGCKHSCENLDGSYICHCRLGYKLLPDKHSCIGECLSDRHICIVQAHLYRWVSVWQAHLYRWVSAWQAQLYRWVSVWQSHLYMWVSVWQAHLYSTSTPV